MISNPINDLTEMFNHENFIREERLDKFNGFCKYFIFSEREQKTPLLIIKTDWAPMANGETSGCRIDIFSNIDVNRDILRELGELIGN